MPEEFENQGQEKEFDLLEYAKKNDQEADLVRTIEVRPGATMEIGYIGRTAWRKLSKALRRMKGSEVAKDAAAEAQVRKELAKAIRGWDGFTPEVVAELMPVKPDDLPDLLPYTENNKTALLLHSIEVFNLVSKETEDLAAFREDAKEEQAKN